MQLAFRVDLPKWRGNTIFFFCLEMNKKFWFSILYQNVQKAKFWLRPLWKSKPKDRTKRVETRSPNFHLLTSLSHRSKPQTHKKKKRKSSRTDTRKREKTHLLFQGRAFVHCSNFPLCEKICLLPFLFLARKAQGFFKASFSHNT